MQAKVEKNIKVITFQVIETVSTNCCTFSEWLKNSAAFFNYNFIDLSVQRVLRFLYKLEEFVECNNFFII